MHVRVAAEVEVKLQGEGPWALHADGTVGATGRGSAGSAAGGGSNSSSANTGSCADDDVQLVFTPGHTQGHVCLYYAPAQVT